MAHYKATPRFTKAQRRQMAMEAWRLLKRFIEPTTVCRYLVERYGIHASYIWYLIKKAREYGAARFGGASCLKAALAGSLADIISGVTKSTKKKGRGKATGASVGPEEWEVVEESELVADKLAAIDRLARLCGLYAPAKAIVVNAQPDHAREAPEELRRRVLENPRASELAHQLYEALEGGAAPTAGS